MHCADAARPGFHVRRSAGGRRQGTARRSVEARRGGLRQTGTLGDDLLNTFALEWPKGSGTIRNYPEVDDAKWAGVEEARTRLVSGQLPILDALIHHLEGRGG